MRYHFAYLTANEQRGFFTDYLHFRNMARYLPGVAPVEITIAVSLVRPFSTDDARALEGLVRCASASKSLRVRAVIWKGNVGRDYSSAQACLKLIGEDASDDDYVMLQNRSAYGPLTNSWYKAFIDQYQKHPGTGLVGNTINLLGHQTMPKNVDARHVQPYVYLSQWRHLRPLVDDFPGSRCTSRPEIIIVGEIGISRRIMEKNLKISCLFWPDHALTAQSVVDPRLPRGDVKRKAFGLPYRHKFPGYLRTPKALMHRLTWATWLASHKLIPTPATEATTTEHPTRYLHTKEYD
jgi:hypothetical protein